MRTKIGIGNDIVDLNVGENPMPSLRFLERVFSPQEQKRIRESKEPRVLCWKLWSAKEAAYKAMVQINSKTLFEHANFRVDSKFRTVRYQRHRFFLDWKETPEFVHCVARSGPYQCAEIHFTVSKLTHPSMRNRSTHSRNEALALLKSHRSVSEVSIHRKNELTRFPGPPSFFKRGRALRNLGLSLSHDGRFVAATIAIRGES